MIPRILERLQSARKEFSWKELLERIVPYATVLRWMARAKAGEPLVKQAGPKKSEPFNPEALQQQIRSLDHGPRRTAGVGALYQQWSEVISRRDFQELVAEERQNKIDSMKRITWLKPGTVWSMDTTDYGPEKFKITPLRDLASKYQVPTPLVQESENGSKIALYLDLVWSRETPPMFLKRDLGSPLNCKAVDDVLEQHGVLPLNSPPGYPKYNGSMERSMQDLKSVLDEQRLQGLMAGMPMTLELELGTHKLNHRRLRVLGGQTPCQCFHDPQRRVRLHGAQRKKIFSEIFGRYWQFAQCMPERNPHTLAAAWRWVVQDWLRCQGWIEIRTNNQKPVSTNSNGFFSHN